MFQDSLSGFEGESPEPLDPDQLALLNWAYRYGCYYAWDLLLERIQEPLAVLEGLRLRLIQSGHSTEGMTWHDLRFLKDQVAAMDTAPSLDRIAMIRRAGCSEGDVFWPLVIREEAEIARTQDHWGHAEDCLSQAYAALGSLVLRSDTDAEMAAEAILSTRIDLAASAFLIDFERGRPEQLKTRLRDYWKVAEEAFQRDPLSGGQRIADGYFYEMRRWDALARHQSVREVHATAHADPRLDPLRDTEPNAIELVRLDSRNARAASSIAREQVSTSQIEASLAGLRRTAQRTPTRSHEWAWLRIAETAALFDLGRSVPALELLDELEGTFPTGRRLEELDQAIAVQRGRGALLAADTQAFPKSVLANLETVWERLVTDWSDERRSRQGAGVLWYPEERDVLETLMRLYTEQLGPTEGAKRGLEAWFALQCQGTLYRTLGGQAISLHVALNALLASDQGLLAYFPGREALHIFIADEGGIQRIEVPSTETQRTAILAELTASIGAIRVARDRPREAALESARRAVSDLLLPPAVLAPIGVWDTVLLTGLEAVGYAPFGYLHGPDNRPLGVQVGLAQAGSISLAVRLATRPAGEPAIPRLGVISLACPSGDSSARQAQLALTTSHRKRLHSGLEPDRVSWLLDASATPPGLEQAPWENCQALFLLTHGDTLGDEPSLVLAGGERFSPAELEALPLPPLIVLDACGLGRSLVRPGDDGRHRWQGAGFVGGARTVVLSVLDIDFEVALELRERVQHALFQDGQSVQESWRSARAELWEKPPEGVHPVELFLHDIHGDGGMRMWIHADPDNRSWLALPWMALAAVGILVLLIQRR